MNTSNHKPFRKVLAFGFLLLFTVVGFLISNTPPHSADTLDVQTYEAQANLHREPVHHMVYKLGHETDYQEAIERDAQRKEGQRARIQNQIEERLEEEKKAKHLAETKAQEEAEQKAKEKAAIEEKQIKVAKKPASQSKEASPSSNTSSSNPSKSNTAQKKPESSHNKQKSTAQNNTQTPPASKVTAPKPAQPSIGSNKIGMNGVFKSYTNYGTATTDQLQVGIDAGQIVTGLTSFSGNDGQTTYFGGHNPGVMSFMSNSIHKGALVTVTDANRTPFKYKMIDKADVDVYGEGILPSIGRSAIDVYMYGTNTESILIQFCNTNNPLMSFWYGVKI